MNQPTNSVIASRLAIVALSICLVGCGGSDDKQSKKPQTNRVKQTQLQLKQHQLTRELKMAVFTLESNVGNLQSGPGYQMWTASKMVDKLMQLNRSTLSTASPNQPTARQTTITYSKDRVEKPWQIVLIPNDSKKEIVVKAYGADTKTPMLSKKIPVSTY